MTGIHLTPVGSYGYIDTQHCEDAEGGKAWEEQHSNELSLEISLCRHFLHLPEWRFHLFVRSSVIPFSYSVDSPVSYFFLLKTSFIMLFCNLHPEHPTSFDVHNPRASTPARLLSYKTLAKVSGNKNVPVSACTLGIS